MGRRVVAVASGKGGVGKTTVALGLAFGLLGRGFRVGLLDADLYGPDVPRMLGLTRTAAATDLVLWTRSQKRPPRPVERHGLHVWSAQFLIAEDQSLSMEAPLAGMWLRRAVFQVDWGDVDWLVVDLPPGTADIQQTLVKLGLDGAVVVVTPQDVAHLDAKKVLAMFAEAGVRVLGGVENMGSFPCPCCETPIALFPPAPEARTIWAGGVKCLARIPFNASVASSANQGLPIYKPEDMEGPAVAFRALADSVAASFD